jgi:hypothetical protein
MNVWRYLWISSLVLSAVIEFVAKLEATAHEKLMRLNEHVYGVTAELAPLGLLRNFIEKLVTPSLSCPGDTTSGFANPSRPDDRREREVFPEVFPLPVPPKTSVWSVIPNLIWYLCKWPVIGPTLYALGNAFAGGWLSAVLTLLSGTITWGFLVDNGYHKMHWVNVLLLLVAGTSLCAAIFQASIVAATYVFGGLFKVSEWTLAVALIAFVRDMVKIWKQ